jgi:UDP-N-acetylglucosamine 2-epimerase (non-hydrolysing)
MSSNNKVKKKVVTILGTRPEIIRLSLIINKFDIIYDHVLVHTGQNYDFELNEVFFKDLNIRKPDLFLNVSSNTLGETLGNIIANSFNTLKEINPDCLLVLGDTNSSLAIISAKRLKIPIFHMEAGNRCFDFNVPEEINRKIADHTSDINLCYAENSRRNLITEGFPENRIFVTGSPMFEVLNFYKKNIESSKILNFYNLSVNDYIVVSLHREENVDNKESLIRFIDSINTIKNFSEKKIIFSVHPRTRKKLEEFQINLEGDIIWSKPLGFFDYVNLQKNSYCVLSDSGTISEESTILNFPAVSLRDSTERPEANDAGSIVLGGKTVESIIQSLNIAVSFRKSKNKYPFEYFVNNCTERVVKIIQSYTDIVNKDVWKKNL